MNVKVFFVTFFVNLLLAIPSQSMESVVLPHNIIVEKPLLFENKEVIISEGSQITLKGDYEHAIHIKNGILRINGTAKAPVLIKSEKNSQDEKEDINTFFLEDSEGYIFHTYFKNNGWALHIHFSNLVVKNCLFEKNYGGIRLTGGQINIQQNIFLDNDIAIRFLNSSPTIENNIFLHNNSAIFIREGVENTTIENNGFYKNIYDLYTGFFQSKDILAINNFFFGDPRIFDAKSDPEIKAKIIIYPMLAGFPDWH